MKQAEKIEIALSANATRHVWTGGNWEQNGYDGIVQQDGSRIDYVAYRWDIERMNDLHTIYKVELEFYHYLTDEPDPLTHIEFVQMKAPTDSAAGIITAVNTSPETYLTHNIQGNEKTLTKVTLGSTSDNKVCTDMTLALDGTGGFVENEFWIGIRKSSSGNGSGKFGGLTMSRGTYTGWEENGGLNISDPPLLRIYAENAGDSHVQHIMRYTTTNPTTSQSTPSNSLGGYLSPNNVFTRSQIANDVGPTQTVIDISSDANSSMPTTTGLAQLGPEIFKFDSIDSNNRKLTDITRGVVPWAFPSHIRPFADYIHYLETDKLFNNNPDSRLIQYRCVAIKQDSTGTISETRVYLLQDKAANVQVDIGIEVPAHDTHTGTISSVITGSNIFESTSNSSTREVVGFASGYFDGAFIDIDSGVHQSIVSSYDMNADGTTAEFILEDSIPAAIIASSTFVIHPAPSQIISNETISPNNNSGRFLGFLGNGGSNNPGYGSIREFGDVLNNNDILYIWIKRTLKNSKKASSDTGAIIALVYAG